MGYAKAFFTLNEKKCSLKISLQFLNWPMCQKKAYSAFCTIWFRNKRFSWILCESINNIMVKFCSLPTMVTLEIGKN